MKNTSEKYLKLKQQSFFVEKELELFYQELNLIRENIKDCNWKLNKDTCNRLASIEQPPALVINICEIFLFTLNQDSTWNNFKVINFNNSRI
jgi:hypothetical protein